MQPSRLEKWRRPFIGAAVAVPAPRPWGDQPLRGWRLRPVNDDVAYPNLMFHFLPLAIRYDGTAGAGGPWLPGPRRADVLRRPGLLRIVSTDPRVHPAIRFNYLSTAQDRREWVEAIQVARRILTQPAFEPYSTGELSPGPEVDDRRARSSPGSRAMPRPRSTRRARPGWASTPTPSRIR